MTTATNLHTSISNSVTPTRRNKRKGVPVKSPSHLDLDTSPGIIFKFPIYFPPSSTDVSPLSPAESSSSSSSSIDEEIVEKSDSSNILHYPVLLSHIARKRQAKYLDFVATGKLTTRNTPPHLSKLRGSSTQWVQNSSVSSDSHQDSHESKLPGHSPSKNSALEYTKKSCASCGVKHTPCWRPGWSEHAPLCNSCGLRYRKTKVSCQGCLYIPLRSELNANANCPKCLKESL